MSVNKPVFYQDEETNCFFLPNNEKLLMASTISQAIKTIEQKNTNCTRTSVRKTVLMIKFNNEPALAACTILLITLGIDTMILPIAKKKNSTALFNTTG